MPPIDVTEASSWQAHLRGVHVVLLHEHVVQRPELELLDPLEHLALPLKVLWRVHAPQRHADGHGAQELHHEGEVVLVAAVRAVRALAGVEEQVA